MPCEMISTSTLRSNEELEDLDDVLQEIISTNCYPAAELLNAIYHGTDATAFNVVDAALEAKVPKNNIVAFIKEAEVDADEFDEELRGNSDYDARQRARLILDLFPDGDEEDAPDTGTDPAS